jgi:hypothetical protein
MATVINAFYFSSADVNKGAWTEEEDRIIITMQQKIGNQWAKVSINFLAAIVTCI